MKAAVFYGKHDLRVEELPIPAVGETDVLVRVMSCGICGTDVHIFHGDEGAAATPAGTVLGHEFAGVVEQVGAKVTGIAVGDRVCVDPNKLCNECEYCLGGLGHFCEHMTGIGTTVHGGFAEFCAVPQSQVYKIPENASFDMAAMTEPVACCVHGIDMCDISCGDTVAVIGGGMIGMIMLQLAKLRGAGKLILLEPVAHKREQAKQLGADLCIDPITEDVQQVLAQNGIGRIAVVIECVGKIKTQAQAIDIAGKKSTVMFFGLTAPEEELTIKPFTLFKKEVVLKASYINPYTQNRALTLIGSEKLDVSSMIYAREPLEKLPQLLADGATLARGKHLIHPND